MKEKCLVGKCALIRNLQQANNRQLYKHSYDLIVFMTKRKKYLATECIKTMQWV